MKTFICPECGSEHEEWPAIVMDSPWYYTQLSEEKKKGVVKTSEFCVLKDSLKTNYFIRAILLQPLAGECQVLDYGVWVSLSKISFEQYEKNIDNPFFEATFTGYLAVNIPGYPSTIGLKCNVVQSPGGKRPEVFPLESESKHNFVKDYFKGISRKEVARRIAAVMNG